MALACNGCGSNDVVRERDAGWITSSWTMLRCRACGQKILLGIPAWTLTLYAIAAAAAVWTAMSVMGHV